ncbi:DNA-binding transcriptional regulator AsnC [Pasteurella multocida subsp. multocida str. Anand1_buffalo]|nr:DNA-binding transcriptional regulator AsnC [Pasteurella multocida subsp. multocida str. Anand1_buffalo]
MHNIDNLDQQILRILTKDARTPYAEMAKNFGVSPGTIHVRVEKMRQAGIIEGTKVRINERKLGYDVCCFIGIILKSAKDYDKVIKNWRALMKLLRLTIPREITRFLLK